MIELSALITIILVACILAFMFDRSKATKKAASKAPVSPSPASEPEVEGIVLTKPESAPEAVQEATPLATQAAESLHVMPMADFMPGRAVDLTAVLRDLDTVFPQIAIRPSTSIEEVQFNAGQRSLADWMRQQYLARGKQAGSMSKAPAI